MLKLHSNESLSVLMYDDAHEGDVFLDEDEVCELTLGECRERINQYAEV